MGASTLPPYSVTGAGGFYPDKGCVPPEVAITGLKFSTYPGGLYPYRVYVYDGTNPNVDPVDPDLMHVFRPGASYLYDGDELRTIVRVAYPSGNEAAAWVEIDRPFPANKVEVSLEITYKPGFEISVANIGGAAGLLNNYTFPVGMPVTSNQESVTAPIKQDAICYDATGTQFAISVKQ